MSERRLKLTLSSMVGYREDPEPVVDEEPNPRCAVVVVEEEGEGRGEVVDAGSSFALLAEWMQRWMDDSSEEEEMCSTTKLMELACELSRAEREREMLETAK